MSKSLLHQYILRKAPKGSGYYYTSIMVHLLHKVSNVPADTIAATTIFPRSGRRYIPFYAANRGGGAITLGSDTWHNITFTENFFSTDQNLYHNKAYANAIDTWLDMSAHEVGHLAHTLRYRFFLVYLIVFIYQYVKYGHDAAPLEIEAERGRESLRKFDRFVTANKESGGIKQLITSEYQEEKKIGILEEWWRSYKAIQL